MKPDRPSEFERAAKQPGSGFVGELWGFLKSNKKWWMLPIVTLLLLLGLLVLFTQGSPLAPFIYTIF